jgi:glycosyltransferase involved in cell wall biosynthesis
MTFRTIDLDAKFVLERAYRAQPTASGIEFDFEGSESGFLVEFGNPSSQAAPKRTFSLDIDGVVQAQLDLVDWDGELVRDCSLMVFLCDAHGEVAERVRLPLDKKRARLILPLSSLTRKACFAVRLAGKGVLNSLVLRIVTLRDVGTSTTEDLVLRPHVPRFEALQAQSWYDLAPDTLSGELLTSWSIIQDGVITELRRELGTLKKWTSAPLAADAMSADGGGEGAAEALHAIVARRAVSTFRARGLLPALQQLVVESPDKTRQSRALEDFAAAIETLDRPASLRALWLAYASSPSAEKARKVALRMFKAGDVTSADSLLQIATLDGLPTLGHELRLAAKLTRQSPEIPPRWRNSDRSGGIAYVASSAPPYITSGYTVRTHQLMMGLKAAGLQATCYMRPGFPWDRPDAAERAVDAPETLRIGDVDYVSSRVTNPSKEYLIEFMTDALERRFRAHKPTVVQAASNYRNALPALVAARRIGVPFIYEVRGLWELSAASTRPGWETTERFALERHLELTVAREADHVLAITQMLAEELISSGIDARRISVLPNAVDPQQFLPRDKNPELFARYSLASADLTLVYAGSLTAYEGLDDLIESIALLRDQGRRVRLLIVGEGYVRPDLEQLTRSRVLESYVTFIDRVAPSEVAEYWGLADAVALPRKAYKVCKIVSPLKPFEAMGLARCVILSDLPVMHEIVTDGATGLICQPEDPKDLARVLNRLIDDPELRVRLGNAGRTWVLEHRTWSANARRLIDVYATLN